MICWLLLDCMFFSGMVVMVFWMVVCCFGVSVSVCESNLMVIFVNFVFDFVFWMVFFCGCFVFVVVVVVVFEDEFEE